MKYYSDPQNCPTFFQKKTNFQISLFLNYHFCWYLKHRFLRLFRMFYQLFDKFFFAIEEPRKMEVWLSNGAVLRVLGSWDAQWRGEVTHKSNNLIFCTEVPTSISNLKIKYWLKKLRPHKIRKNFVKKSISKAFPFEIENLHGFQWQIRL